MPTAAVFLDRDGTLIEDAHYLSHPEQVRLLPAAAAAVRRLNEAGVRVVVVTNQSGVARGYFTESAIPAVHARLSELLAAEGAAVDAFYYCPHHPDGAVPEYRLDCECRKPRPGMLLTAAREWGIDLLQSWMIGDKLDDVQAGNAAGCRTILVRTGSGANATDTRGAPVADDLAAAVELVSPTRGRGESR